MTSMEPVEEPEAVDVAPEPPPRAPEPMAPQVAPRSARSWVGLSVLTMGTVGFMTGFIGPIILTPSANAGPMLGMFITGPLGVVLGLALGIACAAYSRNRQKVAATLLVAGSVAYAAAVVLVILYGGM